MSVLLKTLALLALLAGVADSKEDSVICVDRPKIHAKTASEESGELTDDPKFIQPPYGEVITVHCTGRSSLNLSFQSNSTLQATKLNSTTIQLFLKPDIGKYEYHCIDTTNQCQDTLIVRIYPAITVTSKRFRLMDTYRRTYFVPKGEKFDLFCRGGGGTPMNIFCEGYCVADYEKGGVVTIPDHLQIDTVNKTTIKHSRIADYTEWQEYQCGGATGNSYIVSPWITVKHYPEAQNFRCTARRHEKFECSWNSSSTSHTFKLFYKDESHYTTLICAQSSGELSRTCTSDVDIVDGAFVLETCGEFCDNQTFPFKIDSIVKLDPPGLRIVSTDFDDVTIYAGSCWQTNCPAYKAEHRFLGGRWLAANVTINPDNSYLNVHLPCPDTYYELRFFARNKQATADWLWSEPASISVFTDPKDVDDLDPVCYPEKNLKHFFKYMLALHNISV